MVLNLDLNFPPVEGTSGPMNPQVAPAESSKGMFGSPIDVEVIDYWDDDELKLLPSSAAFPQGRNRARRNQQVTVDFEAPMEIPPTQTGTQISNAICTRMGLHQYRHLHENRGNGVGARVAGRTTSALSSSSRGAHAVTPRARISIAEPAAILLSLSSHSTAERTSTTNWNNTNHQQYVDLEEINNYKKKNTMTQAMEAPLPMPPPPPKELTFDCPLCMDPLKNPCSTFCGHIFCQSCIEACIASSVKARRGRLCPTCRSKLPAKKSFHRIYLPNAN